MKCKQVQKRLSAFLDEELDTTLADEIRNHLQGCSQCHQQAEKLQGVYAWMAQPQAVAPDLFMLSRVRTAVARPHHASPAAGRVNRFLIPATVAAGLALGILLGANLVNYWPAGYPETAQNEEALLYSEWGQSTLTANYLQMTWQEGGNQ